MRAHTIISLHGSEKSRILLFMTNKTNTLLAQYPGYYAITAAEYGRPGDKRCGDEYIRPGSVSAAKPRKLPKGPFLGEDSCYHEYEG